MFRAYMEATRRVYVETTFVSYLTSLPTADVIGAAWQKASNDWWNKQRARFELFTSDVTMEEAGRGDPDAVERRLRVLSDIPVLELTDASIGLAETLVSEGALPPGAAGDALHVALSAVHGMDCLLTWNFRHLDNAERKPAMRRVVALRGFALPEICTPLELMGEASDEC